MLGVDVHAAAALRHAIVGSVDHSPLDRVAQTVQARENDREIAATLGGGGLKQTVDVLKKNAFRVPHLQNRIDAPPENALLAIDAGSHARRFRDGVVLAGEATHEHVEFGKFSFAVPDLVYDDGDILVHATAHTEPVLIAAPCELLGCAAVRLPVVGPDRSERAGCRHVELRMFWIVIAFQAESEPADTGEQFSHSYRALFHGTRYASICIGPQSEGDRVKNCSWIQPVEGQCPEGQVVIRGKKERKGFSSSL